MGLYEPCECEESHYHIQYTLLSYNVVVDMNSSLAVYEGLFRTNMQHCQYFILG